MHNFIKYLTYKFKFIPTYVERKLHNYWISSHIPCNNISTFELKLSSICVSRRYEFRILNLTYLTYQTCNVWGGIVRNDIKCNMVINISDQSISRNVIMHAIWWYRSKHNANNNKWMIINHTSFPDNSYFHTSLNI